MKTLVSFILSIFVISYSFAQNPGGPGGSGGPWGPGGPGGSGGSGTYESYPTTLDSTNTFYMDSSGSWIHNSSVYYDYNGKYLSSFETHKVNPNIPIYRYEYSYDSNNNVIDRINYKWIDNWVNFQKFSYIYSIDGNPIIRNIYNWINESWTPSVIIENKFEGNLKVGYDYKSASTGDILFISTMEYEADKLTKWYIYRASNNTLYRLREYYYNNDLIFELINIKEINGNYIQTSKSQYIYDQYNLLKEVHGYSMVNDVWEIKSKTIYYRKIESAARIAMCYNGNTIIVQNSSILNFLDKGATLDACETSAEEQSINQESSTIAKYLDTDFKIFPNPANDFVQISGISNDINSVQLFNSSGMLIKTYSDTQDEIISINRNGLPAGMYFLKFTGKNNSSVHKFLFK